MRIDGREYDELRNIEIIPNYVKCAEGSAFISMGDTRIICTASVEDKVPPFLRNTGQGWIAAEYGMLPRSSSTRIIREVNQGRPSGRTQEIQRMIGRALRTVSDLYSLGERTIWIDCDVIEADGGTRAASITAGFIALSLSANWLYEQKLTNSFIINDFIAAVSAGIINGKYALDMTYLEDSKAEVDFNIAMNGQGKLVEIHADAERVPFTIEDLNELINLAKKGVSEIIKIQKEVLKGLIREECFIKLMQDCMLG